MNRRIGNHFDWEFLQTRMYTPNWQSFPVPLAFQINALMTHHPSTVAALTRRSVLVTEAKGHGTHVSKFVNNRLSNPRRCPEKETTQVVFKKRVVVKIRVPSWVPIIIQHLLFRVPKKGP